VSKASSYMVYTPMRIDVGGCRGCRRGSKSASRKIRLSSGQSPGDILMLTAAVRDLHKAYPGRFLTDVKTSCHEIWENNPYITNLDDEEGVLAIECHYPLIHKSNTSPYHFIHGYAQYLEERLRVKIPLTDFKGDIHLSRQERGWAPQVDGDFWIIVAGGKHDFTAKWWNPKSYQAVVNHFSGKIRFVQVGEKHHWHPPLKNVIDLRGKTDLRQFIRLMYHAKGVVCPVTFAMHAAAAVPMKSGRRKNRPCVVIAGGREPQQWEAYPHHRYLSTNGCLPCCDNGGCWVSRCQKVGDGDKKDRENLCQLPVKISKDLVIPKCMSMIEPRDVIRAIEMYESYK